MNKNYAQIYTNFGLGKLSELLRRSFKYLLLNDIQEYAEMVV